MLDRPLCLLSPSLSAPFFLFFFFFFSCSFLLSRSSSRPRSSREALCIWILNFNCAFQVQPLPLSFVSPAPSPSLLFPPYPTPASFPFNPLSLLFRPFLPLATQQTTDNHENPRAG